MEEIKVWAQIFFDDGSVTQGKRIPAQWLDEGHEERLEEVADALLKGVNRDEGFLLIWGAGNMCFYDVKTEEDVTSCVQMTLEPESDFLA